VADLAQQKQWGLAFGLYNAVVGIVALPASLLAGVIWQGFGSWQGLGPAAPFLLGAMLAVCAIIILRISVRSTSFQTAE
jgi:hypothetical protein